ncbi:MAG TPA: hypothetical protein PLS37_06995 [Propioniciclava tarda]|nr:hypothetical protein [Propioniciclava tarda]
MSRDAERPDARTIEFDDLDLPAGWRRVGVRALVRPAGRTAGASWSRRLEKLDAELRSAIEGRLRQAARLGVVAPCTVVFAESLVVGDVVVVSVSVGDGGPRFDWAQLLLDRLARVPQLGQPERPDLGRLLEDAIAGGGPLTRDQLRELGHHLDRWSDGRPHFTHAEPPEPSGAEPGSDDGPAPAPPQPPAPEPVNSEPSETLPGDEPAPPPPPQPPAPDPVNTEPSEALPGDDPAPPPPPAPTPPTPPADRLLQCEVGAEGAPFHDNVLRAGRNTVSVFVGAQESTAVAAGFVSNAALGLEASEQVTITVQLTPLAPVIGTPSIGQLVVNQAGRTENLPLPWDVPPGTTDARAQLALTRDGRVVAVADLVGRVGGPVTLTAVMGLGPLDASRPRSTAPSVVLDADGAGRPTVTVPGSRVDLVPDLADLAESLRKALNQAVNQPRRATADSRESWRSILVAAAQAGRDLFLQLRPVLGGLADADAIQVVASRAASALPLELLYLLRAPRANATLCPAWASGGCSPATPHDEHVVCPSGFWGVTRVVERHYRPTEQDSALVSVAVPDADRQRLRLDGLLLAASTKVTKADLRGAGLDGATRVRTWDAWRRALSEPGAGVLVLMPHTTPDPPTLEVSNQTLHRASIEADLVTGGRSGEPVVVLFGCDTGGSADDPIGFATRFLGAGAGVVFASFTLLHAAVAPVLASRLVGALRDPGRRGQTVGRVLTDVRREALADGWLAALAMTAYGDADWEV